MLKLLIVGVGGFLGAVARHGISQFVHHRFGGTFPLGVLVVNVLGCFVIGVFMHLVQDRNMMGHEARLFWMVGLLGGLTTFSAFGYDTVGFMAAGNLRLAALNVATNLASGLSAVWLGYLIADCGFGIAD